MTFNLKTKTRTSDVIKKEIFDLVTEYHLSAFETKKFNPGHTFVPVSGKVFDQKELQFLVDASLDGWFTTGRFNEKFEKELARYINTRKAITVNSGSSANLIATATLTAHELGERS